MAGGGNPNHDARGRFSSGGVPGGTGPRRQMNHGEFRAHMDSLYAQGDAQRQSASEAHLRTPAGEAERQARNAATVASMRSVPTTHVHHSPRTYGGRVRLTKAQRDPTYGKYQGNPAAEGEKAVRKYGK
jgi:hypothetical protein